DRSLGRDAPQADTRSRARAARLVDGDALWSSHRRSTDRNRRAGSARLVAPDSNGCATTGPPPSRWLFARVRNWQTNGPPSTTCRAAGHPPPSRPKRSRYAHTAPCLPRKNCACPSRSAPPTAIVETPLRLGSPPACQNGPGWPRCPARPRCCHQWLPAVGRGRMLPASRLLPSAAHWPPTSTAGARAPSVDALGRWPLYLPLSSVPLLPASATPP